MDNKKLFIQKRGYQLVRYDVKEWIRLFNEEGKTLMWIADKFHVSDRTVSKYLIENGINTLKNQYRSEYDKYDRKWIELYNSGVSAVEIAKEHNVSYQLVCKHLRQNGIKIRGTQPYHRFKKYVEEWSRKKQEGVTLEVIAKEYGTTSQTVAKYLKNEGVLYKRSTIYSLNVNYFKKIDSYEKAYWLGFIMADGCIVEQKKANESLSLQISLNMKDEDHLIEFLQCIHSTHPVRKTSRNEVVVTIYNYSMCQDLISLGVKQRKTKIAKFPFDIIDEEFYKSFILGYFDGDGSIYFNKGSAMFSIVGTEHMVKGIQSVMIKSMGLNKTKIDNQHGLYRLVYGGNNQVSLIFKWLYKDAEVYMKRKYNRFLEI